MDGSLNSFGFAASVLISRNKVLIRVRLNAAVEDSSDDKRVNGKFSIIAPAHSACSDLC